MKTAPLLIVTPTLGRSPWLERTVASVAAHAGGRARHLLVAPPATHADLHQRFPQCELVAETAPRGVYGAINLGLQHAHAGDWQWFTWLNDDDELQAGFAPHLSRALCHHGRASTAPWTYGQVRLCDGHDGELGRLAVARRTDDLLSLVQGGISPLNQQGLLAPRCWVERLGGLREDLRICADLDFWLRALTGGAGFRASREVVATFRLRAGQVSGDVARHRAEFAQVVHTLAPDPAPALRRLAARLRFRLANAAVYTGRIRHTGFKGGFALLQQPAAKTETPTPCARPST